MDFIYASAIRADVQESWFYIRIQILDFENRALLQSGKRNVCLTLKLSFSLKTGLNQPKPIIIISGSGN
jgi:hypothetical protein